jgi:hypothetical protein
MHMHISLSLVTYLPNDGVYDKFVHVAMSMTLSGCDTHGSNGFREVIVGPFLLRLLAHELLYNVGIAMKYVC